MRDPSSLLLIHCRAMRVVIRTTEMHRGSESEQKGSASRHFCYCLLGCIQKATMFAR